MHKQRIIVSLILVFSLLATLVPIEDLAAQPLATPIPETPTEEPTTPEPSDTPTETETAPSPEVSDGTQTVGPATPGPESSDRSIAPRAAVPGGTLAGCNQVPPNGDVRSNAESRITCTMRVASQGTDTDPQRGRVTRPTLANGFTAAISVTVPGAAPVVLPAGNSASTLEFPFANGVNGFREATVQITVSVSSLVGGGTRLNANFSACSAAPGGGSCHGTNPQQGVVVVSAQVPRTTLIAVSEGTHYTFACDAVVLQAQPYSLTPVETVCSVRVTNAIVDLLRNIQVAEILTSRTGGQGQDWTVQLTRFDNSLIGNVPTTPNSNVFNVPAPSVNLGAGETFQFKLRLTPNLGCSTSNSTNVAISVGVRSVSLLGLTGNTQYSSSRLIQTTLSPIEVQNPFIEMAPGPIYEDYSLTDDTVIPNAAELTIRLELDGCDPWSGYISMDPFSSDESAGTDPVPYLSRAGHGTTTQNPPGRITVTQNPNFNGIGTEDTLILSGTRTGRPVTVFHTIVFEYTIPADTPVGTYTSEFTITTSSAP